MKSYVASHLKDMNRQVVYNLIVERNITSRAEISKLTGISSPTVIKIVEYLIQSGLILELGEGKSSVGRKPQLLTINRDAMYTAVFFLEGEFLTLGIADITGNVLYKKTLRCQPFFDTIMDRISSGLVDGLFAEAGLDQSKMVGIGMALPAIYDPEKKSIITAPLIGIHQQMNISIHIENLAKKYGVRVWVENDANSQCVGEYCASKLGEGEDLVFISIGTGIGAGIILDGKLRRGARNFCGEIGYISLSEDYISDSKNPGWLENRISYHMLEEKFDINVDTDLSSVSETTMRQILEYVSIPLTLCINNISMILDCKNIRLGGIVVNILGKRLIDFVNQKLRDMSISNIQAESQSNEDIGLMGIASQLSEQRVLDILSQDIQ